MPPISGISLLRDAAECALAERAHASARVFQYVAGQRGEDLARPTVAASHDGGSNDGGISEDDYGGPMCIDGEEGLVLPATDQQACGPHRGSCRP